MPTLPINWLLKNHISGAVARSPVELTITFVATQFDYKFKAPSGSTLIISDGDGTVTEVAGNDAVWVTHTTGYSGAGTYNFSITGDTSDQTAIDINNQAFVSGSWTGWASFPNLTYLDVGQTGTSGNVEGYAALTSMTVFNVDSTTATGDGHELIALTSLTSFLFNSTSITWGGSTAMNLTSATVNAASSGMSTSTQVDNFIDSFKGGTSCTYDVSGTNAHRTSASNDDLNTLLANGNTITLNDTLGSELNTTASAVSDPNSNEADSVGDFLQVGLDAGANVFDSQEVTVNVGSSALEGNANDTPTNLARFYLDLEAAPISLSNSNVYRLEFDARHIGSGGNWAANLAVANQSTTNQIDFFTSGDTAFRTEIYYWTHDANHRYFNFRESSGTNDGGIYFDNFSIKQVTFP